MSQCVIEVAQLNIDKHPIVNNAANMREIAQPLTHLGITHFAYQKLYPGHISIIMTTHPEMADLFFREKFYHDFLWDDHELYDNAYLLLDLYPKNKILDAAKEYVKLSHYLLIVGQNDSFCESFYFATNPGNYHINNLYLSHKSFFYSFCDYFKKTAQKLIQEAEQNRIICSGQIQERFLKFPGDFKGGVSEAIQKMQASGHTCENHLHLERLSSQEANVIPYIMQGKTAKEIARLMSLSPRTVEKYLESIKYKLDQASLPKLVHALHQAGIS